MRKGSRYQRIEVYFIVNVGPTKPLNALQRGDVGVLRKKGGEAWTA
jgi:hypothetical protein